MIGSLRLGTLFVCSAILFVCSGCGDKGPKRYDHWGTITFKGQPIPKGIMYFDPDLANKQDGPQGFAEITNGQFDTRTRPDSGPGSGKYILRIFAADGLVAKEANMGKPLFQSDVLIPQELPAEPSELNVVIPETAK